MRLLDSRTAPDGVILQLLVSLDEAATLRTMLGEAVESKPVPPPKPWVPLAERTPATSPRCPDAIRDEIAARLKGRAGDSPLPAATAAAVEAPPALDRKSAAAGERSDHA